MFPPELAPNRNNGVVGEMDLKKPNTTTTRERKSTVVGGEGQ